MQFNRITTTTTTYLLFRSSLSMNVLLMFRTKKNINATYETSVNQLLDMQKKKNQMSLTKQCVTIHNRIYTCRHTRAHKCAQATVIRERKLTRPVIDMQNTLVRDTIEYALQINKLFLLFPRLEFILSNNITNPTNGQYL